MNGKKKRKNKVNFYTDDATLKKLLKCCEEKELTISTLCHTVLYKSVNNHLLVPVSDILLRMLEREAKIENISLEAHVVRVLTGYKRL